MKLLWRKRSILLDATELQEIYRNERVQSISGTVKRCRKLKSSTELQTDHARGRLPTYTGSAAFRPPSPADAMRALTAGSTPGHGRNPMALIHSRRSTSLSAVIPRQFVDAGHEPIDFPVSRKRMHPSEANVFAVARSAL